MLTIDALANAHAEVERLARMGAAGAVRATLAALAGWRVARSVRSRGVPSGDALLALVGLSLAALAAPPDVARATGMQVLGRRDVSLAAIIAAVLLLRSCLQARRLAAGVHTRFASPRGRRSRAAESGLWIGSGCETGRPVRVPARHVIVVGATGSGKTVTLRRMLAEAATSMGIVAVDGKGDPELERDIERAACVSGRRFQPWSPYHSTSYSPFCHGSDTEVVDKALAAERWGDDYYLRLGQRFLGFAVRALRAAGRETTLRELAHFVDPENLEQLAPAMETATPGSWGELVAALPALDRAERQAIAGTQHRLATLAESDVGGLLEPVPGRPRIDLLEIVRAGDVAYFNLNADARPALSRMIGAAIVMDLVSVAAAMQRSGENLPTVLMLDDVQAFASVPALAGIASLFARGRSAGMMLVLGTQSLADLALAGSERGTDQLLDNRTTIVVHRLPSHGSASRASRELGERAGWRVSEHLEPALIGWRSPRRIVRTAMPEPNVTAQELMELETGVAAVQTCARPPEFVRVASPLDLADRAPAS